MSRMFLGGMTRRPAPRPPATVLPTARPTAMPVAAQPPAGAAAAPTRSPINFKLKNGQFDFNSIMNSYRDQQDKANNANETRYQGILSTLQNQGASAKADVARAGGEERAGIMQGSIDRGLFNTSVLDSLNNNSYQAQNRENTRIDESVADRTAGVMERRTDQGPDMGLYAGLLQSAASGMGALPGQRAGQGSVGNSFSFAGMGGGGSGGGGGTSRMSTGPGFGQGGGGGGGSGATGVQTFTNDIFRAPQAPMAQAPAASAAGPQRPNNTIVGTPAQGDLSDPEYWVRQGYRRGAEANNMAQRNRR